MAMRPIVARVETTTELAGIIFAEDSRRPFSEIVRFVVVICEMKSVAGRSTRVAQGIPPPQYSSTSDLGVPPLSTRNRVSSPRETSGKEWLLAALSRYRSPLKLRSEVPKSALQST